MGRIKVAADLSIPGFERIYALGDVSGLEQDGAILPALAQVAKQQGVHLGRALRRLTRDKPLKIRPFRYRSRGDTAIIGRSSAVFVIGPLRLKKTLAWMMWAFVHVYLLIGFDKRVSVALQWGWRYLTSERGARLID